MTRAGVRPPGRDVTRRDVLRIGAYGMGAIGAIALPFRIARAQPPAPAGAAAPYVPKPGSNQYTFRIARKTLSPDGKQPAGGILVNGTFPGPEVRVSEGDLLRIEVENQLDEPTSIHWHGILLPAGMDGVPDISNAPIAPGRIYVYEYPIRQTGTYWYHSHYLLQEQVGCAGPFIIEARNEPKRYDHDAVVMLSDWIYSDPNQILPKLRSEGAATMKKMEAMKGGMKSGAAMGGADLSDVKYDAFLLNGRGNDQPWTLAAKPGERIRLRFIDAGASTYFRVKIDGHPLQVTHADGLAVQPVEVDDLLMGMGECYDVMLTMSASGSYTIHGVAMDGSGQAIGVLHTPDAAPKPNREIPSFGPRTLSYNQLVAPAPTTLPAGALREFKLGLQGDMANYIWKIGGQVYPNADPLVIRQGERVRVSMVNETSMWHPMHVHGHFFRVLTNDGPFCPLKHTVNVAPMQTLTFEFTADNPGNWFFHCHNLYHLEAGMARRFEYQAEGGKQT